MEVEVEVEFESEQPCRVPNSRKLFSDKFRSFFSLAFLHSKQVGRDGIRRFATGRS